MNTVVDKNVSITNGASVDVMAIDAFQPASADGSTPVPQQMYEQTLTPLNGARTIPAGGTATFALDGTYVDSQGTTQYRTVYDLIFARPADLFPVSVAGEMLGLVNPVYPPISIAAADQANHVLALKFLINLMAYPTSSLATNYQAALTAAGQNATRPGDVDAAMARFFAGTKQYQSLTVGHVTAVTTYVNTFAFLWAGVSSGLTSFDAAVTYYVYKPGTTASGLSSANPVLVGTLALARKANAPSPAGVTDANAGYTCTFADPGGNKTAMFYQAGQFVSDTTSDSPNIALKGSYVLKSFFTNNPQDTMLVPMIGGQVDGVKVLGTTTAQTGGSSNSQLWAFFHPTTFAGWLNIFLSMFGVLMALDFAAKGAMSIGKGIKSLWDKYKGNEPPATEIEQLRTEVRNLQQEIRTNQQALLDRLDPGRQARVADPEEFSVAESEVEASLVDNRRVARQELIEEGLKGQAGQVEKLAEYEVGPQLEQVADNIRAGNQAIQQAQDPAALDSALDKASENLAANLDDIEQMVASIRTQLTTEASAALQAAQDDVSQLHEDQQAVDDQQGDAEGSEGGDDDLPIGEDV